MKFDGVDLFLFDPHVSIDSTDDDLKQLADKIAPAQSRRRLARRAGLAADRRRLGDGQRRGAQGVRHAGAQGLRDRQEAERDSASASTASSASTRRPARRTGRRIRPATRRRSPRRSARRADVAEGYGERLAAEGEICWGGMHSVKRNVELLELVGPPEDRRLPGRHGAHAALHAGLQRARRSHPARRTSTGPISKTLDEGLRRR